MLVSAAMSADRDMTERLALLAPRATEAPRVIVVPKGSLETRASLAFRVLVGHKDLARQVSVSLALPAQFFWDLQVGPALLALLAQGEARAPQA
jgi:hypothetical protein